MWSLRRFRLFWAGDTISAAGGALSAVAVPLLAIETRHASDTFVGVLRAAQTLPFLLLAIPIGLLADRVSRRRLLLAADAVRFPLVAVLALAGASFPLGALVTLVFTIGIATIAYEVAYLSVLPELVAAPADLPAANRAVESAHAGASLLGPAVGGALVAALSAPAVIALDALSFAAGATLTAINRWDRHRRPAPRSPAVAGERALTAGWNWLRRDRYVRPLTLYLAANNVAAQAFQTALLLFVVRVLDRGAAAVVKTISYGSATAGAFAGGVAAAAFGARAVIADAALVSAAATVCLITPAIRTLTGTPTPRRGEPARR